MILRTCVGCGHYLTPEVRACPFCGRVVTHFAEYVLGAILAVLVVAAGAVIFFALREPAWLQNAFDSLTYQLMQLR
jgi:uncharacterized OB-fold protein